MASNDSGGIYCFFPFERFDHKGNGVFKIGNTEQTFQQRIQQYHTYFVNGVWEFCFLKIAPKPRKRMPSNFKHILNDIETWVLQYIEKKHGVIIADRRRVFKQGQSEWVFTNLPTVREAFEQAKINYEPQYPDLHFIVDCVDISKTKKELDRSYRSRMAMPEKFISEYIFNVNKADNIK